MAATAGFLHHNKEPYYTSKSTGQAYPMVDPVKITPCAHQRDRRVVELWNLGAAQQTCPTCEKPITGTEDLTSLQTTIRGYVDTNKHIFGYDYDQLCQLVKILMDTKFAARNAQLASQQELAAQEQELRQRLTAAVASTKAAVSEAERVGPRVRRAIHQQVMRDAARTRECAQATLVALVLLVAMFAAFILPRWSGDVSPQ